MPGTGIVDFEAHAMAIAKAGIYDLKVHHEQILVPVVLRHWGIEDLEGLTPEAEEARTRLVRRIDRIGKAGRRLAARWAEAEARALQVADAPAGPSRDEVAAAGARPGLNPSRLEPLDPPEPVAAVTASRPARPNLRSGTGKTVGAGRRSVRRRRARRPQGSGATRPSG